jgi:hypothetical protein
MRCIDMGCLRARVLVGLCGLATLGGMASLVPVSAQAAAAGSARSTLLELASLDPGVDGPRVVGDRTAPQRSRMLYRDVAREA